jgi:peroxiredoxin
MEQRLHAVTVRGEPPFFDARERAALAWAEALTGPRGPELSVDGRAAGHPGRLSAVWDRRRNRMRRRRFPFSMVPLVLVAAGIGVAAAPGWTPREGRELLGTAAPEWSGVEWIQGGPLSPADLRGRVVLLRFWLVECPYCQRSAAALRTWSKRYAERGLVVVGLHHPKSEEARDPVLVRAAARGLGFEFPVGIDNDWTTVRAYGVGRVFKRYTSVSFLIDRRGIIRFVHDGGEYHSAAGPGHEECGAAYRALESAIRTLLAE